MKLGLGTADGSSRVMSGLHVFLLASISAFLMD